MHVRKKLLIENTAQSPETTSRFYKIPRLLWPFRTDLICTVPRTASSSETCFLCPNRVWTRLSLVNHASYRAYLHLNASRRATPPSSTLLHSCPTRFPPSHLDFPLLGVSSFYRYCVALSSAACVASFLSVIQPTFNSSYSEPQA